MTGHKGEHSPKDFLKSLFVLVQDLSRFILGIGLFEEVVADCQCLFCLCRLSILSNGLRGQCIKKAQKREKNQWQNDVLGPG